MATGTTGGGTGGTTGGSARAGGRSGGTGGAGSTSTAGGATTGIGGSGASVAAGSGTQEPMTAKARIAQIDMELSQSSQATDEDERRLTLLHRNLQKHGTVFNTLAGVCEIEGELIAERPAPR